MIEYCEHCGIEIEKGNGDADIPETCRYCGNNIDSATRDRDEKNREPGEPTKLFLDLTVQPLKRLLRSWKDLDTAALVLFPILLIVVLVKKVFGSSFLGLVLLDAKPKFRIAGPEDFRRTNPKSIGKASAFFRKLGFAHCLDLVCLHYSQPVIKRIYASLDLKRYGSVCVGMAAGKVQFATLETFTAGGKCICVVNRELLPIQTPGNIVLQFFHGASPERLSEEFEKLVERNAEPPVSLPLAGYLRFLRNIEAFIIEQGVLQGVFVPGKSDEGSPAHTVSMCANHPASMAARTCSECGASLCESCYTWRNDAVYCDRCFARFESETPAALPLTIDDDGRKAPFPDFSGLSGPALESGYGFAGLGARGLAKLIDLFLIFAFTGIAVFAFHWALTLAAEDYATSMSVVFAQLFFALAFVVYFTALFRRWQGGAGHRILGMRVVDRHGRAPSLVASVVRFGYHLFSCLFIFPALGYLFIAFSKNRRGLHDKLADTWVIARHPVRKALLGWSAILALAAPFLWNTVGFRSSMTGNLSGEIALEKKWGTKLDTPLFLRSGYLWKDSAITTVSGKLTSVDMVTGEKLWVLENSDGHRIATHAGADGLPLIAFCETESGTVLYEIRPEDGDILWKSETKMKNAQATVDPQGVLVRNESGLKWFDKNGSLVWETTEPISASANVRINGDLFVSEYVSAEEQDESDERKAPDSNLDITCISLADGKLKWREKNASIYAAGTPLANGFEIVPDHRTGGMTMMHLPERRAVWTMEKHAGPVFAHKPDYEEEPSAAPLIYTDTMMIRGSDGTGGFEYPTTLSPPAVTDRWLILKTGGSNPEDSQDDPTAELTVLNRFSGNKLATLRTSPFDTFYYISEDESFVYLGASRFPKWLFLEKASSSLLLIDKRNRTLRELNLGENASAWGLRVKAFPENGLVFIATNGSIGTYRIDATSLPD